MPRRRTPTESLLASFKNRHSIARAIASDTWTYAGRDGITHVAKVQVGRPQPVPRDKQHDWFCPVYVDGWTPHVVPAIGVGPFDSLMNALRLVRSFREHVADLHITERSRSVRRRR